MRNLKIEVMKELHCDRLFEPRGGGVLTRGRSVCRIPKQGCGVQVSMQTGAIHQSLGAVGDVLKADLTPNMAFVGAFLVWIFEF